MTSEELFNWCCKQKCNKGYLFECDLCNYNKGRADTINECLSAIEHCVTGSECRELLEQLKDQGNG